MAVSRNALYNMDQASQELMIQENILKCLIDIQTTLQLLVDKEVVTREEVAEMRSKVTNQSRYKGTIESIQQMKDGVEYYKNNPEAHLRDVLKAKMEGKVK
jgi:hypothetical protein